MGDDPERMDAGAVIVAKPVQRAVRRDASANAGYLYLVLHTQQLPEGRWDVLRSSFARPVMGLVIAVVAFTTLLALLIISAVTQPLEQLTRALATLSQRGLAEGLTIAPTSPLPATTQDEFGQLTSAFEMLLDVCRRQWNALRRRRSFPPRRRQQPVARPAFAADRDGRLPRDARRPLERGAGARRRSPAGRDRAAQYAQRRAPGAVARRPGQARRAGIRPAHRDRRCRRAARRHRRPLRRARGARRRRPVDRCTTRPSRRRRRARASTSSCSSAPSPTWSTTR